MLSLGLVAVVHTAQNVHQNVITCTTANLSVQAVIKEVTIYQFVALCLQVLKDCISLSPQLVNSWTLHVH